MSAQVGNNTESNRTLVVGLTIIAFVVATVFGDGGGAAVFAAGILGIPMVFMKKSECIPPLIVLCTVDASSTFILLIAMFFVCLLNINELFRDKHIKLLCILLLAVLPLYISLVFQRHRLDGDSFQWALSYAQYYMSFWTFLYCYLISKSFSQFTVKLIVFSVLLCIIVYLTKMNNGNLTFGKMTIYGTSLLGIICLMNILQRKKMTLWLFVLLLDFLIIGGTHLSFTNLLVHVLAFILGFCVIKNKKKWAFYISGYPIYIVWVIIMVYAVSSYSLMYLTSDSEYIDFSSWNNFNAYLQYKLFSDRAPFWDGAYIQLLQLKPIFPMHNIPDISYSMIGREGEVSFGGHNTFLQLLRIFGFIMGGVLIFCYIKMTTLASKVFDFERRHLYIALFSTSIAYVVALCLTGTSSMMNCMSMACFGILGVAYRQSNELLIESRKK